MYSTVIEEMLPLLMHREADCYCILSTHNTIGKKELKWAGLFPVCRRVSSWIEFLALPLWVYIILRQSQSFSSLIYKLGLMLHLMTLGELPRAFICVPAQSAGAWTHVERPVSLRGWVQCLQNALGFLESMKYYCLITADCVTDFQACCLTDLD